jgi:DNA polymerase III delta prime subunit
MNSKSYDSLIIHPESRKLLDSYLKTPTQTLLLVGTVGVGLGSIASALARQIAGPDVIKIQPTQHNKQKTININSDDIRNIGVLVRSRRPTPLVVILDEVDKLTSGAPEALLKLLEEPVANVHFILTTHNLYNLPATVISRSQIIRVLPSEQANLLLRDIKPTSRRQQIQFMADKLPAEIQRLTTDDDYFRAQSHKFEVIKKFINADTYQRLIAISQLKTRDEALDFLDGLARVTAFVATQKSQGERFTTLSETIERVHRNGNLKAQLTYLATKY